MVQSDGRISWDAYFMRIAKTASLRASCFKKKTGAVIVKDKQIIATGYNGAPKGLKNCFEHGFCLREKNNLNSGENLEICLAVHAEQNAIIQAAVFGVSTKGATMYTLYHPCEMCARIIINAGIKEVVYERDEFAPLAKRFLAESSVIVRQFKEE